MSLQQVFSECFVTAFAELTTDHQPGDIAGLGAFTDDDASSIVFMAHTRRHENAQIEADPEYACDAVWNVFDWDLGYAAGQPPPAGVAAANHAIDALRADDIRTHRELVWNSAIGALTALVAQGFFDRWPDAVRAFLVADGGNDQEMFHWQVRLNTAARIPELREFFDVRE